MRSAFPWFWSPMNPLSNWRRSVGGSPARDDCCPGVFSHSLMTTPLRMIVYCWPTTRISYSFHSPFGFSPPVFRPSGSKL